MYGVLRIVLALGLINLPEMGDHLDVDAFHDFILIRDCMPREMFFLVYCRFFHMVPAPLSEEAQRRVARRRVGRAVAIR